MKITIARVMHFVKAADDLQRFVNEQVQKAPAGPEGGDARNGLLKYVNAVDTVQRMASDLQGAEVTVKG